MWKCLAEFRFEYYNYEERSYTNVGDIAIRMAIADQLQHALAGNSVEIVELAWGDLSEKVLEEVNQQASLFVIGGSGYYHCNREGELNSRLKEDIAYLERMRCPIVTDAVGINCLLTDTTAKVVPSDQSRDILVRCMERLAISSVRDPYTKEIVDQLAPSPAVLIADSALFS